MINLGLISKSSQRLMHNLAHLLLSFQKRSRVQGASRACVEPLRLDELREERVHGSVAELLQICELQTFCRDRVLSVQVRRKEMKNIKKKRKIRDLLPIRSRDCRRDNEIEKKKKKFYKSTTHTVVEKFFSLAFLRERIFPTYSRIDVRVLSNQPILVEMREIFIFIEERLLFQIR